MLHKYDAIYDVESSTDYFLTRQLFVSTDIQTFVYTLLTIAVNYFKKLNNYEISDVFFIKNNLAL